MTFDLIFALHIELHSLSTSTLNLVCFLRDWLAGELLSRLVGGIYRRFGLVLLEWTPSAAIVSQSTGLLPMMCTNPVPQKSPFLTFDNARYPKYEMLLHRKHGTCAPPSRSTRRRS